MYWLLPQNDQDALRKKIQRLVDELSRIGGNPQSEQLFPYVGRKDKRKAAKVVEILSEVESWVMEPFAGSGAIVYAIAEIRNNFRANEWEPYAWRMSNAPWRVPLEADLQQAMVILRNTYDADMRRLYKTICPCGQEHVLDSFFFDRVPLRYQNITRHERLGPSGENITYRTIYACPACRRTEKFCDQSDINHLNLLATQPEDARFQRILIENSRINLTGSFTQYSNLFPHRSKLALISLWKAIEELTCSDAVRDFFKDAFLSILPQAKFKDYRSKSQDLHCPEVQLREVNIFYRFFDQVNRRFSKLASYNFSRNAGSLPIEARDFRDFMGRYCGETFDLIITDPPWCDGNAYFEKAQLYHPWIGYELTTDQQRLTNEFVVSDAPSRRALHNMLRWWNDMQEFFRLSRQCLKDQRILSLYFRPIPARQWLTNLNKLKLLARMNGFEPLLSIDVGSSDPSMRIQQSASYVFSDDIVFLFLKLPAGLSRFFYNDTDIDYFVYKVAEEAQEEIRGPFTFREWRDKLATFLNAEGLAQLNAPEYETKLLELFMRYCSEVSPGLFLPRMQTPFSDQLFDTPAIERLFIHVPDIVRELTRNAETFSYDGFLIALSTYLENGTRSLINQVEGMDITKILAPYAEPLEEGRLFRKKTVLAIPGAIGKVMDLDPYQFEIFTGDLLRAQGFTNIGIIGRSGDRGVDLTARDPQGNLTVVQCKRFIVNNVSSTPIQRLHSFAVTRGATRKILITTSGFTPQAIDEAKITNTELINRDALEQVIAQYMSDWSM